ncbi:MAG: lipocalin-like domain-containing protein [Candidatus Gastranaerophilaceae bacterium]|jgi:predicted secreted hydrolase
MKTIYKPIKFPKDGKEHKQAVEWWYFNGHLKDKKGNHYSFMNCLFKINVKKIGIPFVKATSFNHFYFAHSIVSDIAKKKSYRDIKNAVVISNDSFSKPLLFIDYIEPPNLKGYENSIMEEKKLFYYHVKNENLDLNLRPNKKPMLEGGKGFNDLCGMRSFYYSLTNMKASGEIIIDKEKIKVSGKAWMDHQWTNTVSGHNDRWNWFSIQLDNNIELMCVEYISGEKSESFADIFYKDEKHEVIKKLKLNSLKIWKSKETNQEYPIEWEIEIPEKDIRFKVKALINDQEMKAGLARYWEGPTEISGIFKGKQVKGLGFMEIVNHAFPYGVYSMEEIKGFIKKIF